MHKTSFLRMEYLINYYQPYFGRNKQVINVLDIGSCNGSGSYKQLFIGEKYHYVGLDMVEGNNVDIVPEDIYCWNEIKDETFDLVISGQVFEHIEYPWLTIKEIERVLKPSGFCIIIAPNSGMEHKAPKDCYRYYPDGFRALARWANLKVHHVSIAGVTELEGSDDWVSDWNDGCLVAQKQPAEETIIGAPFIEERRVPVHGYFDTYKLWEKAAIQAWGRFHDARPIALFGAGWIGQMVLEILGNDKVYCFIDNAPQKQGTMCHGKKVISLNDYMKEGGCYNCLITASYKASVEIKSELDKIGLKCEILY